MSLPMHHAIIVAQAAHQTHDAAVLAAMHATRSAASNAAVLMLADRYLTDLSDAVVHALSVDTVARRVLISASTHRQILERREISSKLDADLVA